uniref:Membrane protein BRI3 n=1 Tax=Acrobeloides nanus TaxID=290746 RepID=A0A914C7P0_9BILA
MAHLCPVCHNRLKVNCTWKRILWAIFCFPCGLLCCTRRRKWRCRHCGEEVIISNGSVPTIVEAYKHYKDFKWQFPSKHRAPSDTKPAVTETDKEGESSTDKKEGATDKKEGESSTQQTELVTVT